MRKIFNSVTAIYEEARAQEQIVRTGTWREQIQAGIVILLGIGAIGTAVAAGIAVDEDAVARARLAEHPEDDVFDPQ